MKKKHIPWVIILAVLLADQVLKVLVKTNMTLGQSIPVFGDWFILHFTENYGMAFGMEFSGAYGKLLLSLFRIVAVGFIGIYLFRLVKQQAHTGLIICVSLILAGALGNIIDSTLYGILFSESYFNQLATFMPEGGGYASLLHGKVVDMLYFPVIKGHFPSWFPFWAGEDFIFFRPVFNLADSAITTGVMVLLVFQKRFFLEKPHTEPFARESALPPAQPEILTPGFGPIGPPPEASEPQQDSPEDPGRPDNETTEPKSQ